MTRGEKLKIYRTGLGLSQEKVAELVGVSRQAVTKWENNQAAPSTENLIALASLYHVSLDELVADRPHERKKDPQILHANLTLIAIILQASWLNVAMRPLPETDHPSIRVAGWVFSLSHCWRRQFGWPSISGMRKMPNSFGKIHASSCCIVWFRWRWRCLATIAGCIFWPRCF